MVTKAMQIAKIAFEGRESEIVRIEGRWEVALSLL